MITLNYLAILIAALAAYVIGFLWYGPVFGKVWMALSKINPKEMKKPKPAEMTKLMGTAFIQQLVKAYVLAHFVVLLNITDAAMALQLAFWIWLGFIAMAMLDSVLWEKRTVKLYLFNIAYHLVALVAMTLVLALWK